MGVVSCGTTMLDQGVFENIGAVTWDTTVKTSGFTAVSGNGYFCNTTSAAFTVTLPSSPSAGDIVGIKDYANTADTNNITIGRNGSNIQGEAADFVIDTEGRSVLLVYVDATKGWLVTSASQASDIAIPPAFITATGGTITESGDFKIHTFTGPGTFCVSGVSCCAANNQVSYMVVAGGGGGGGRHGGGGGAGGFREDKSPVTPYTASPLEGAGPITVTATAFPITVGGGGTAGVFAPTPTTNGGQGGSSIFSTITSAGGGGGGTAVSSTPCGATTLAGGSGGGGTHCGPSVAGGNGNTPPVSPAQGTNGGTGLATVPYNGGGGGGATAAGGAAGGAGGVGGAGATTSINASSTTFAGGGGGGAYVGSGGAGGSGGGGGGSGSGNGPSFQATAGTVNTGGGGGGTGNMQACQPGPTSPQIGSTGGSGIVIIRYKFQ